MTSIIQKRDIPNGSIIKCFDTTKDTGLFVQFESEKFEKWIGVFKNGSTSLTNINTLTNGQVVVAASGRIYIIDPLKRIGNSFQNEYCDLQIDKDQVFIASFSLIDIYKNNQLQKRISIDDIDGIRFSSLIDNTLNGAFRQIDQVNFGDWISFNLNTLTHEFNCDHGRMWEEISYQEGKMTTRFLTMGLK